MVSPPSSFAAIGKETSLAPMTIQSHKARRHAAPKRIASPARAGLTEEQALHALETEISRKVGLQMKEADYPDEARRWAWGGTTLVKVLVNVDGVIGGISVGKTSGFRMLDEQAVRVVSRVRSPSWIPDRLRGREISVLVPIGFILPHRD
jgi:protein TonB